MTREPLFSVTAADCDFQPYRGSGKGGQKKNKTSSAIRCTHRESGATGCCEDGRSQWQNKKTAFSRMAATDTFKNWLRMEAARKTGDLLEVERAVERSLRPANLIVEGKGENGKWERID